MRLALLAVGLAVLASVPAAVTARAGEDVPVRPCRSRGDPSDGAAIRFARAGDVVIGPVSFAGLRSAGSARLSAADRGPDGRWFVKAGAKVLWGGGPVTVRLARADGPLALAYARDGARSTAVRFEPCRPGTPMFLGVGVLRRVTVFPGGFSLARRGCYALVVEARSRTYRRPVSFGAGRC
jgi:hypothetical protein